MELICCFKIKLFFVSSGRFSNNQNDTQKAPTTNAVGARGLNELKK